MKILLVVRYKSDDGGGLTNNSDGLTESNYIAQTREVNKKNIIIVLKKNIEKLKQQQRKKQSNEN